MTPERLASLKAEVDKQRASVHFNASGMEHWRVMIALYDLAMAQQAKIDQLTKPEAERKS